jgi:two-component system, NarL family, nitrate/nitrite response regulator NarL
MAMRQTKPIRVLLVDDHAVVRSGLRMLVESRSGLKVAGEAANRAEALAVAKREQPDVILLDLDMNNDNGLNFLPQLLATAERARVLILTGVRDPDAYSQAIRLGASGLLLKEKAADVLIKAIEKVHAGEVWFDRSMIGNVLTEMSRADGTRSMSSRLTEMSRDPEAAKIATLTEREREVSALIGEGLKNKQIASRLFISETTVRHHLTSIFDKLGVSDRLELIIYTFQHGLAKPPC